MTPAILDYVVAEKGASASADEYRQMTNGLALALNGQFGALTRIGFVLDAKTKADIKSGTEMERSAAIVRVLNSTYKDFASTAGNTAAGSAQKLSIQINNLKQTFGEVLLPTIQRVQAFVAEKLVPIITGLMDKFKDGTAITKMISFVESLLKNLVTFGTAVIEIAKPILQDTLVPAFKLVGGAIVGLIKFLGSLGGFLLKHKELMTAIGAVIIMAGTGFLVFNAALIAHSIILKVVKTAQMAYQVAQLLMNSGTLAQVASTNTLAASMLRLNAVMRANPIGLIVTAIALAAVGLVYLWKHSDAFRKIVIAVGKAGVDAFAFIVKAIGMLAVGLIKVGTGPLRLLLKGLSLLGVDAAGKALSGIESMTDGVGKFFDDAAKKVEGFKGNLDKLNELKMKPFTQSMTVAGQVDNGKGNGSGYPDLSSLDPGDTTRKGDDKLQKAAAELAAKIAELKSKLKDTVVDYNDFIVNDFAAGFVDGAEKARDTMLKGLDELKKVFDAQQAIYEANNNTAGVAKVKSEYDKINAYVRGRIAEAMKVAKDLEDVNTEIDKAKKKLEIAVANREEGAATFASILRRPFGQPSEIDKALADGETTIDNIIGMYDRMVEAVNKRFDKIDSNGQQASILAMLESDTKKLIDLNVKQKKIVEDLKDLQKDYDDIKAKQKSFRDSITDSLKSFGSTLADLSKGNADTTIKVIKTATGLVVTQMAQGSTGVVAIIDKLKTSLKTIKEFTTNIQALLAAGYNKEYVRTLLEAGPEAAGATAALLAKSGSDTMATVNELYTQIGASSETFGASMSATFYDNSVAMAKALVDGAESKRKDILNEMALIAQNIQDAFKGMSDVGTKLGEDLIQSAIDKLNKEKARLINLANEIAASVALAMANAAAAIGVGGVTSSVTLNPTTDPTTDPTPTPDPIFKDKNDTVTTPFDTGTSTKTPTPTKTPSLAAAEKYIVKSGDTLSAIAKANNTSLKAVLDANPKFTDVAKYQGGNMIWSGTTVNIPAPAPSYSKATSGVNTNSIAGINAASGTTNNFEKGAFSIVVPPNTSPEFLEPVMTNALVRAMSAR